MANDTQQTTNGPVAATLPQPSAEDRTAALARIETDNVTDGRSLNAYASAANFAVGQRIAQSLATSTMVPQEYRGNVANVMLAMELANRIGASVFSVMQNIDIIHGRPSWRATFLIATVNACGRFTPLRFRFQGKEGTEEYGCRAVAKDKETGEECVGSLITLGMAKAEGWSSKNGSKWKTMPEQMLMYRSAAFWSRVFAPELSNGMSTADEAEDITPTVTLPAALTPGNTKTLEAELLCAGATMTPAEKPPSTPEMVQAEDDGAFDRGQS